MEVTTPHLTDILERLVQGHTSPSSAVANQPLIVRIASPVYIRVIPPPLPVSANIPSSKLVPVSSNLASEEKPDVNVAMIEAFMNEWTHIVGDPVLSKWIVLALAVSVFLNGYLLKGIGASTTPIQQAVSFAGPSFETPAPPTIAKSKNSKKLNILSERSSAEHDERMDAVKESQHVSRLDLHSLRRSSSFTQGDSTPLNLGAGTPSVPATPMIGTGLGLSMPSTVYGSPKRMRSTSLDPKEAAEDVKPATPISEPGPERSSSLKAPIPTLGNSTLGLGMMTPAGTPRGTNASIGRRAFEECLEVFENEGVAALNDEEIILLSQRGKIAQYALEKILGDFTRAVRIRRALICKGLVLVSPNERLLI